MGRKIITTVLDFGFVFENMSQAETFNLTQELNQSKLELNQIKTRAMINVKFDESMGRTPSDVDVEVFNDALEQMHYLNLNLTVLENVLLAWESKCSEKRSLVIGLEIIWLN